MYRRMYITIDLLILNQPKNPCFWKKAGIFGVISISGSTLADDEIGVITKNQG